MSSLGLCGSFVTTFLKCNFNTEQVKLSPFYVLPLIPYDLAPATLLAPPLTHLSHLLASNRLPSFTLGHPLLLLSHLIPSNSPALSAPYMQMTIAHCSAKV